MRIFRVCCPRPEWFAGFLFLDEEKRFNAEFAETQSALRRETQEHSQEWLSYREKGGRRRCCLLRSWLGRRLMTRRSILWGVCGSFLWSRRNSRIGFRTF